MAALFLALQGVPALSKLVVETPQQGIDAIANSISAARAKAARLPAPKTDSERLIRMAELEQAPRIVMMEFDLGKLSDVDKQKMREGIWAQVNPIDHDNQAQLLAMVPPEGWFSSKTYGWQASISAFLIVQHSNHDLWRRFLPSVEAMVRTGEADGGTYALMYDRLALSEGRPQRYGSQMVCKDGHFVLQEPVEDFAAIDARRKELGMSSLEENLKQFENAC